MIGLKRFIASLAMSGAFATAAMAPAHAADPVENFYKGKTVQVLVGFGPGGGYDLYARTLARYMGKHIPGNPTMVPQNMPGAGGVKVMNYLYNVARKDGTAIGTFARGLVIEPPTSSCANDAPMRPSASSCRRPRATPTRSKRASPRIRGTP